MIKGYFYSTYQIMAELNFQTCTLNVEMIREKAQNLRTRGHGAKPKTDLKRSSPHRRGMKGDAIMIMTSSLESYHPDIRELANLQGTDS